MAEVSGWPAVLVVLPRPLPWGPKFNIEFCPCSDLGILSDAQTHKVSPSIRLYEAEEERKNKEKEEKKKRNLENQGEAASEQGGAKKPKSGQQGEVESGMKGGSKRKAKDMDGDSLCYYASEKFDTLNISIIADTRVISFVNFIFITSNMSTSLKVVSIAVSFLTPTSLLATFLLSIDIFSRLVSREPVHPAFAIADEGSNPAANASRTSFLSTLPPLPVPAIEP